MTLLQKEGEVIPTLCCGFAGTPPTLERGIDRLYAQASLEVKAHESFAAPGWLSLPRTILLYLLFRLMPFH